MRRSAREARAELARLGEDERACGPPAVRGRQPEDLRGRVVGTSTVVGFLAHDKVTPWWIVRCDCGAWDVARGSAIREGKGKTCPACQPDDARRAPRVRPVRSRPVRLRLSRDAAGALLAVVESEIDRLEHGLTEGEDFTAADVDVESDHADYVSEKRQDVDHMRACVQALRAALRATAGATT